MSEPSSPGATAWSPSVYYAESEVRCPLEQAWPILLDYQAWNPDFVGARVTPVRGDYRSEGELVLIRENVPDASGQPPADFYAETIKVARHRHIVWYVYPKVAEDFRNFVDLGLEKTPQGVRFSVAYYEQSRLTGEQLANHRIETQAVYHRLVAAFKAYCERGA